MTHLRRSALPAAALTLGLALTGCSSSGSQVAAGTSPSPSSSASSASSSASSPATAASSVKVGDVVDFSTVAKKASDAGKAKGTAHVKAELGSSMALEGDVDVTTSDVSETITMGSQELKLLVVDKVVYLGGGIAQTLGAKTPWVQIDPKGGDPLSQRLAPLIETLRTSGADPTAALSSLKDTKATVSATSASSTTYKVTLTKAQLEELAKTQPQLKQVTGQSLGYDYTVDAEGLPTRVAVNIAGQSVATTFSDWGKAVDLSAPAASEVTLSSKITKTA